MAFSGIATLRKVRIESKSSLKDFSSTVELGPRSTVTNINTQEFMSALSSQRMQSSSTTILSCVDEFHTGEVISGTLTLDGLIHQSCWDEPCFQHFTTDWDLGILPYEEGGRDQHLTSISTISRSM